MDNAKRAYGAVVIGVSTGGVQALSALLGGLPAGFALPVLIVQHIGPDAGSGLARLLDDRSPLDVKEADEQDEIRPGTVYLAPPNYHMLVERGGFIALSEDAPVSFARPSVDVLFESAADVYADALIGVVLTGANHDGSRGLKRIKERGGVAVVQDPADADAQQMPLAALAATEVDYILPLDSVPDLLQQLAARRKP